MKKYIKIIMGILILFVSILIVLKFINNKKIDNIDEITEVVREDLIFNYNFQGYVVSQKEVLIYSPLQGDIKRVNFRLGDEVKKGDILVEIDESALLEINNTITKAKMNLSKINKKYVDTLELYNIGSISKSELIDAKDNLTIAQLDYKELIDKTKEITNKIKSTVSGTIIESNVDENFKIDQSKHLYKIVDTENLKIVAEVPNDKVVNFKIGDEVKIESSSLGEGNFIIGKIDEISKISTKSEKYNDTVTKVSINLEPNTKLKPGDIVNMEVVFEKVENALVINYTDLMVDENNAKYVYIVDNKNKIRKVYVEAGITNNIKYEIKSGLKENDRVINNLDSYYKEGDSLKR